MNSHFWNPSPPRRNPPGPRPRCRRYRPVLEQLENRLQPSAGFRPIDGAGNNLAHPDWGTAGIDLLRLAPAAYTDGLSAPAGADRPSARVVSNSVADQAEEVTIVNDRLLSAMLYAWGQFLDHDLDLTLNAQPKEPFNVPVQAGDPFFDPFDNGNRVIPLNRSAYDPATGITNARQQVNSLTAWIDGSQVYGSDAATADKLRTHVGGRLKTSAGEMLPLNDSATFPDGPLPMANDAHRVPDAELYAAGDVRANENVELTSLHTLFVREHNRVADAVSQADPSLDDEAVYQRARAWVIGEMQAITYKDWLPALLGPQALGPYPGYDPSVNPGIANEFSTAAFRFGHSLLGDEVEFRGDDGLAVAPRVPLSEAFSNPPLLAAHGLDPILKYLASDPSSELDTRVVNSVRNFLFGPPGAGGLDLASLNIQRGRDHGLADYNSMRDAFGLPRVTGFDQITHNTGLQDTLRELYGNVDHIDAWVGALAEDHVAGGSTGPLLRVVLLDQFARLRAGDRFWYQNVFSGQGLQELEQTTLADVIRRNTGLTDLQSDVFFFQAGIAGTVFAAPSAGGQPGPGAAGQRVELVEEGSGRVVASTQTDDQGHYRFGVADGLRLGHYRVRVAGPDGSGPSPAASAVLALTVGGTFLEPIDLGLSPPGQGLAGHAPLLAFGAGAGSGPGVLVTDPRGAVRFNFFAFDPNFSGGVRVAVGDVNGDGTDDIIAAAGPGGGPNVSVFDGRDGSLLRSFFVFDPAFAGGVSVAAGDVNGDGRADIVCGAGAGGGPNVIVFDGQSVAGGESARPLDNFMAFGPGFTGGVSVAAGDVDDDGRVDLVCGAGPGGGPNVTVISGADGRTLLASLFPYARGFTGGVSVAAGDADGDGRADVICGPGPGGGPNVLVLSGADLVTLLASFFAYDPTFTGGVRVSAADNNGDGRAEVVCVAGPGGGPAMRSMNPLTGEPIDDFFSYDPRFGAGLFVAGPASSVLPS